MNSAEVNVLQLLVDSYNHIVRIAVNELNEQQDFIHFKLCRKSIPVDKEKAPQISDFYRNVVFPYKEKNELTNLIIVKDFAILTNDREKSVNTHFTHKFKSGFVTLKEDSTISYLKYDLLKQATQIVIKKYLQHKSEGCFFDNKTDLSNTSLCDYCESQLLILGVNNKTISNLERLLESIKKTSLGITRANLFAVIIMDIVGYSKYSDAKQKEMIVQLQKSIFSNEMIRKNLGDIVFLPTGDGCAIALGESIYRDSVKICANLQMTIKDCALQVRYGMNFGSIFRYRDLNNNINIAGSGINMAARVMNVGDANHIIANRSMFDSLGNLDEWHRSVFHQMGSVEVKHGVQLEIFNIYSEEEGFGNKKIPEKLERSRSND